MKKIEFSVDKKREIIDMYNDKSIKVSEILDTYNISNGTLNRLLRAEKVPFRVEKAAGKRTNVKIKRCHICGKSVMIKDASYCPFCGADVRSKSEKLTFKLAELWNIIYPNFRKYEEKEEARKLFEEIKEYIQNN